MECFTVDVLDTNNRFTLEMHLYIAQRVLKRHGEYNLNWILYSF